MSSSASHERPHRLLDRLAAAGADQPDGRRFLAALRDQLDQNRFRVLVTVEAKRGKCTLLNALLGRDVLPTGAVPVTALATTLREGEPEVLTVPFADGRREERTSEALGDYVTQAANPGHRLGVTDVVLRRRAPLLSDGVEFVDTPATGSVHGQDTDEALAPLRTMDAALFVLTADPPISAAEHDLLRLAARASVHTIVVLNRADLIRSYAQDLREHLNALGDRRTEALDLVRTQGRRTLQDLNARAQQATSALTRQVAEEWSGGGEAHGGE
ncbi:dynamin family protein [Streptomyces sp. NPDC001530]|uniref:dynamin family protein n=1 Tax=Streptomyces sp. NPDC001530 TaxID=3364582 RepID=UPI0036D0E17D